MSEEIGTPPALAGTVNSERYVPTLPLLAIHHNAFQAVLARRQRDRHLVQEIPHLQLLGRYLKPTIAGQFLNHFALRVLDAVGARLTWSAGGVKRSRLKNNGGSYLSSHDMREVLGIGTRGQTRLAGDPMAAAQRAHRKTYGPAGGPVHYDH